MNSRKISLIIALLLSVCFVYAQSEIDVTIINGNPNDKYICSVQFNQSLAIPTTGFMVFTVPAGTTHTEHFEFDEYDVNLKGIKCYMLSGATPDAYIVVSSWLGTTDDVAPVINAGPPPTYWQFEFDSYSGSGIYEHLTFSIHQ